MQWDESRGQGAATTPSTAARATAARTAGPTCRTPRSSCEALRDTGLPADDPALQKALVFVSRCQNLKSEFNDQPWAGKVNDGGFIYTGRPTAASSVAGKDRRRRPPLLRRHDLRRPQEHDLRRPHRRRPPRQGGPARTSRKHYTLDENPGLGQAGLYYYYQTFAKAMALLGKPTLIDASGKSHDWRADLVAALAKRQNPDGSWVNPADRFMEGDPNLVTAYGLLALAATRRAGR